MNELARIETVIFLQRVDLFRACDAEQILRISAIARQQRFNADETIYAVKDPSDSLYCVVRGRIDIVDDAGVHRLVASPGTLGVSGILSGRLRTDTATATEDTLVLALDADDFFDLLANNIEIVRSLFRQLLDQPKP
ncbi:MAG: cyclic nucleotide-binding domain-containing protein [Acidobacteriota bacterium]|nr:cyclic nucleotide-binding domain-containing protein [Acidobacteriota bacterium]